MIHRVLVANRGEIARRVIATCRRLGIETVAVHSDADADLPYVAEADVAVRLPGDAPAATYLDAAAIVAAARRTGADAVHPGYGFGSENADHARAVEGAGLVWVGPTPESIEQMGSKIGAKRLVRAAGVPVLESPADPTAADPPLLVKASAGGGGRGMRVVRRLADLADAVAAAEAEAAAAFGDGTVFVEPYVEHGRHVEVQVVGDGRGGVLVLGERDCSVQRRHQKVVEEAPAPCLPAATRDALHEAAWAVAAAIDYRGAGTVELLYDPGADRFWFLEMNTRLQVEHPVTECVHGLDLVELQLAVAEGRDLPEPPPGPTGHAVEARLYAEDPADGHRPQSGLLTRLEVPHDVAFGPLPGPGVRLDAGHGPGSRVTTHYDAMLAKVVAWAPTREQAVRMLAGALRRARIHGVATNRDQLLAVLGHEAFRVGGVGTDFLATEGVGAQPVTPGDPLWRALACFAAAVAVTEDAAGARPVQRGVPVGWRNVVSAPQATRFSHRGTEVAVRWHGSVAGRDGYLLVDPDGVADGARCRSTTRGPDGWTVRVALDDLEHTFSVAVSAGTVDVDGACGHLALDRVPRFADPAEQVAHGSLLAPMPGTVVSVVVAAGDRVAAGSAVLVLEAMKMQHTVAAPHAGTVTELDVRPGAQVAAGDVLAVVRPGQAGDTAEEQG